MWSSGSSRRRRCLVATLSVVSLAVLPGCESHSREASAHATPTVALGRAPTSSTTGTALWRKDSQPVGLPSRWVLLDGNIGVTKSGCFTIGDAVLWADQHSRIVSKGTAVRLTGVGTFRIGDHLDAPGYYFHTKAASSPAPTPRQCADGHPDMAVASLYSPHIMRSLPPCLNEGTLPFC